MSEEIKIPEDITIGFGTFRAGVRFETVKKAVDRHNAIYQDLLKITPTEVTNEIVRRLNSNT